MITLADTTSLTKTTSTGLANVAGTDPVPTSTGLITATDSGGENLSLSPLGLVVSEF